MQRGNHLTDQPQETVGCDRERNQYSWQRNSKPHACDHFEEHKRSLVHQMPRWLKEKRKGVKATCMIQRSYMRDSSNSCILYTASFPVSVTVTISNPFTGAPVVSLSGRPDLYYIPFTCSPSPRSLMYTHSCHLIHANMPKKNII